MGVGGSAEIGSLQRGLVADIALRGTAALVPAKDGLCWWKGDPHRGRQGLHRPEHCRNEGGDRPATRELPAETSGRENQQEGLFCIDAAVLSNRGHGQAGEAHLPDVRRQQRRQDTSKSSWSSCT